MQNVIGLLPYLTGVRRGRAAVPGDNGGFTRRDRTELDRWSRNGRTARCCSSELGDFAMLYEPGGHCASWGVTREAGQVLLWDCVSFASLGRFPTVGAALLALEDGGHDLPPPGNVVYLVAAGRQGEGTVRRAL